MNLPLLHPCRWCGHHDGHEEDCPVPEHEALLAGDPHAQALHDPEDCPLCLWERPVTCACRCGRCCEALLIEATAFDAEREPRIRERASIIDRTPDGRRLPPEEADWFLNSPQGPCVFFHRDAHGLGVCEIHQTRPLACRLFDCDRYEHREKENHR